MSEGIIEEVNPEVIIISEGGIKETNEEEVTPEVKVEVDTQEEDSGQEDIREAAVEVVEDIALETGKTEVTTTKTLKRMSVLIVST